MYQPKFIYTDNPFADYIIYWTKYLAMNCVIKNERKANECETLESAKNFDRYVICKGGRQQFDLWDNYPLDIYRDVFKGLHTDAYIRKLFMTDKLYVPKDRRQEITDKMAEWFLANYQELNPYYREIHGLRPLESECDIKLEDYGFVNDLVSQDSISYTYLHELPIALLIKISNNGILDKIIKDYPEETWIQHIPILIESPDINESIRDARRCHDFELLYLPSGVDENIRDEFVEKYSINREYVLHNIYSEAYKVESDYYDNFIQILIIIMTVADMLDSVSDHIVRKDIIDPRCIQYIFEQYGIPYYNEIPIKYQYAMCKNINTLLKFKSSARCMVDICSLFGFDSSEVFQLYLLRKRKMDEDGNFLFNYKTRTKPNDLETVTKTNTLIDIEDDMGPIILAFPVLNYFENGNIVEVWMDDELIPEEYYQIYDSKLTILDKSILKDHDQLEIRFIYNENPEVFKQVPDYDIKRAEEEVIWKRSIKQYQLNPPLDDYFKNNGIAFVIMGTLLLHPDLYIINQDTNILSFTNLFYNHYTLQNKYIKVIYFYSQTLEIKHVVEHYKNESDYKQRTFTIPEPYPKYYESGRRFLVSIAGTYISKDRYHIEGNQLIFNSESDGLPPKQTLTYHFIYNDFYDVELNEEDKIVEAEVNYQIEFDIPVPFDSYFTEGNVVFVKIRNSYLPPEFYTILKNKLIIKKDYSVYKGGKVEFHFIYGKLRDVKKENVSLLATIPYQQDFIIPWPYEGFLARGNKMKVMYNGVEYVEGRHFVIKDNKLEIFRIDDAVKKGDHLEIYFYHHPDNKTNITIRETQARVLKDNQRAYTIPVPFYKYFSTGNKMLITQGSTFIPENQYEIKDNRLFFHDDSIMDFNQNRELTFTFIYHTEYDRYNQAVHVDTATHYLKIPPENPEGSLKINIPWPFDNYMELGNEFELRVDGVKVIPKEAYDIVDYKYALIFKPQDYIYPYGKNIEFVFTYSCSGFDTEVVEDLEKDIELKFVKIPILENPDRYLKDDRNYIEYEEVTDSDPTWNGDFTKQAVKEVLINDTFSYTRTKYFSISNLSSMGDIAYQVPYFMNMLFDKVKLEEHLTLKLPYINSSHIFKFNDTLVYMMALSHRYLGIDDDIPTIQKALYIKGFNFEADLSLIATYIKNKLGENNPLKNMQIDPIWQKFAKYSHQIPSYKELIEIYTTNTEIYNHVVHEMINADNKIVHDIYKKIYESLMITKESKEFFSLSHKTASSMTEWLANRDNYLYYSLMDIDSISDENTRKVTISKYLENCIYQINEYISSEDFQFVLRFFSGADANALLKYLTKVINFFKSYKIQIYDISINYIFDDKLDNTIRAIDLLEYNTTFKFNHDGHSIFENMSTFVSQVLNDKEMTQAIREKLYKKIRQYLQLPVKDRPKIKDYLNSFVSHMIRNDEVKLKEFMPIISSFLIHTKYINNLIDSISAHTTLTPEERIDIEEKYIALIRKYVLMDEIDEVKYNDDINNLFVYIETHLNYIEENIKDSINYKTLTYINDICSNNDEKILYCIYSYRKDIMEYKDRLDVIVKFMKQILIESKDLENFNDRISDFFSSLKVNINFTEESIKEKPRFNIDLTTFDSYYDIYEKLTSTTLLYESDIIDLKDKIKLVIETIKKYVADTEGIDRYADNLDSLISKIKANSDYLVKLLKDKSSYNALLTMNDNNFNIFDKVSVDMNGYIKDVLEYKDSLNLIETEIKKFKLESNVNTIIDQISTIYSLLSLQESYINTRITEILFIYSYISPVDYYDRLYDRTSVDTYLADRDFINIRDLSNIIELIDKKMKIIYYFEPEELMNIYCHMILSDNYPFNTSVVELIISNINMDIKDYDIELLEDFLYTISIYKKDQIRFKDKIELLEEHMKKILFSQNINMEEDIRSFISLIIKDNYNLDLVNKLYIKTDISAYEEYSKSNDKINYTSNISCSDKLVTEDMSEVSKKQYKQLKISHSVITPLEEVTVTVSENS